LARTDGFVAELRRRNVLRAAALYAAGAWLLVQVATQVLPFFDAPNGAIRGIIVAALIGFPFWLLFAWFYELTPEGFKREADVLPDQSITRQTGQRMEHAVVVLLVLALGYFGVDKFLLAPRREAAAVTAATVAAQTKPAVPAPAGGNSIAVLPLANGGGADQQFFSDGLSEALIIALSQFEGLTVIGRTSSFQFRDSQLDSAAIGNRLGVTHLVEGSVQHAGDAVRVSVELIDAGSGRTLWSQRYDRPYEDLFKLLDDITGSVAGALKARLLADADAAKSDRPPSGNLEAYDAYLQGMFNFNRANETGERAAIVQFNRAIALDPEYGLAYAQLARIWSDIGASYALGAEVQEALAQAELASKQALALAPGLAMSHIARGNLLTTRQDWAGADAEFRRVLELAPGDAEARAALGQARARKGELGRALQLTRAAMVTEPLNARLYRWSGYYLLAMGRLDEAEQALSKAIELKPDGVYSHYLLATLHALRGDASAAFAAAQGEPPGYWRDVGLALAAQVGPDHAQADRLLKLCIRKYAREAAFQIAEIYALRGDPDQMFAWLERARRQRDPGLQSLLYDAPLLRYRDDLRFAAFAHKIGLPGPAEAAAADTTTAPGP
jgi:TolB-like protein/Tfp pilus assembly protein PilF